MNNFKQLYSDSKYDKPSVTVDAVIFRLVDVPSDNYRKLSEKKLQVYLINRRFDPYKGQYSVPGTFIDLNFELNESMRLCVLNKVGLNNYYYEQLFTFGEKQRDPRSRVLSVAYMLLTPPEEPINDGEWFDVILSEETKKTTNGAEDITLTNTINLTLKNDYKILSSILETTLQKKGINTDKNTRIISTELAFDHIKIIYYALERLKNKLEYTDIIFNLLPKKFTLTELKQSYEVILQQKLLDANFRRKTAKLVQPIDEQVTGKGHRRSQLFIHNPLWILNNLD